MITVLRSLDELFHAARVTRTYSRPSCDIGPGRGAQIHPRQLEHPQRHCRLAGASSQKNPGSTRRQ
eukprot:scaffold1903_cov63-Phaeocystis_antarctica.AAC.5